MPAATLPPSPNGLPIVRTQSPTLALPESPQCDGRQRRFRLDLEQRQVGDRVASDHLRRQDGFVRERHRDLLRVGDDMVIGDDQPRRIDDEPGTQRGNARVVRARRALFAEEFAEHLVERAARRILRGLLRGRGRPGCRLRRHVDDAADQPRRQLREKIGERRLGRPRRGRERRRPAPRAAAAERVSRRRRVRAAAARPARPGFPATAGRGRRRARPERHRVAPAPAPL